MTLLELIGLIKKRLALVIALPIVFGVIAAVYCFLFMPNEYTATTSMYVLSSSTESTAVAADSRAVAQAADSTAKPAESVLAERMSAAGRAGQA